MPRRNPLDPNTSGDASSRLTVPLTGAPGIDPGLARVVAAWPELPGPIKAAVLALVNSAASTGRSEQP